MTAAEWSATTGGRLEPPGIGVLISLLVPDLYRGSHVGGRGGERLRRGERRFDYGARLAFNLEIAVHLPDSWTAPMGDTAAEVIAEPDQAVAAGDDAQPGGGVVFAAGRLSEASGRPAARNARGRAAARKRE